MSSSYDDCSIGFTWSPDFELFDFGPKHPIRVGRFRMIKKFLEDTRFLEQSNVKLLSPEPLPEELLRRTHSDKYLEKVRRISESGEGEIDIDTPGYKGIYENAKLSSGATLTGIQAILESRVKHMFSPTGGFHHARYETGGGFSIFNDVAASVYYLKDRGFKRILVADFDVHHGNGTQSYFYDDPEVMQISFHEDPDWMYPHDGHIQDIGSGAGRGYNINMHFPMDSGDQVYQTAFDELVPKLVKCFKPQFILFLPGFDAHYVDPLAHLILTTKTIRHVTEYIHSAAHRWANGQLAVMSGGGYHRNSFSWGAGIVMSVLSGLHYEPPPQTPPFEDDEEIWEIVNENISRVKKAVFPILGIE
ncbi:MAG: histone deacetylase family protein [Candidatus Hodarchaeota archaeon]